MPQPRFVLLGEEDDLLAVVHTGGADVGQLQLQEHWPHAVGGAD